MWQEERIAEWGGYHFWLHIIYYLEQFTIFQRNKKVSPAPRLFYFSENSKSLQMVYNIYSKQDGVGPVDYRPSNEKLHHFVFKENVTCYTWHVTTLPSSYCLWFMILWRSGGKGSPTELINDEAVYRAAPTTPGLLNIKTVIWIYCITVTDSQSSG